MPEDPDDGEFSFARVKCIGSDIVRPIEKSVRLRFEAVRRHRMGVGPLAG